MSLDQLPGVLYDSASLLSYKETPQLLQAISPGMARVKRTVSKQVNEILGVLGK